MNDDARTFRLATRLGTVRVATRDEVERIPAWQSAFAGARKDRRHYEIAADTLGGRFEHRYFLIEDPAGRVRAVQPFFLLEQDVVEGAATAVRKVVAGLRRVLPGALRIRTLMVGSAAGEGHLDHTSDEQAAWVAGCLHDALLAYARVVKARLVVLKEFPAAYREPLRCFVENGYTRVPSFPMTRLNIEYGSFDEYMTKALSHSTRKNLRRKFRNAARAEPIEMEVVEDVERLVDEIYPLYLNVYRRSSFHFEKLTPEFLVRLGREMPDKTRFFVWRQSGRAVAFSLCMTHGDTIYDEYVGLDYAVAFDLHLYFTTLRDIVEWAIEHGYAWYASSALGYEPKRRLGCELVPLDLYVAHTSPLANAVLRRALPLLEPTRGDKTLRAFANYLALRA